LVSYQQTPNEEQTMSETAVKTTSTRRYDLDWLRVLAILTIFTFHTTRFFDLGDWHVKNPATYLLAQTYIDFLVLWIMPLIFVISGMSLFYALGKGGFGRFAKDKVLRLGVPLLVGAFTHASIMVYLERTTHHLFSGTYFQFLPLYFQGFYGFGGNFAWMGLHLWYLLVLFVFSLVMYPFFRLLKGPAKSALAAFTRFLSVPGMMYFLAAPIMWVLVTTNPRSILGMRDMGGWYLFAYLFFFLNGFILISSDALQRRIIQFRWVSLALGLGIFAAGFIYFSQAGDPLYRTMIYTLYQCLVGVVSWCIILAILGFGMQKLNFTTPFLQYASEAVLPFYILHQTVLLLVGYYVVRWSIPDPLKWLVIAVISFALIIATYEYLIRRNNALRFLFGMKPLPPKLVPTSQGKVAREPVA
jgi:glucans biosynthesis protein C